MTAGSATTSPRRLFRARLLIAAVLLGPMVVGGVLCLVFPGSFRVWVYEAFHFVETRIILPWR